MKIYVASSYRNIPATREVMNVLRSDGHEITHDWTERSLPGVGLVEGTPEAQEYLEACGREDFEGVRRCSVLVLLAHPECRDAMVEFGIALGMRTRICVLYPEQRRSVFYGSGDTSRFSNLEDLRSALRRIDAEIPF